MARISGEIPINRGIEEVFDFVAHQRNEPIYNPRMLRSEKISSGPVGVGTRFRAIAMSGRRAVEMYRGHRVRQAKEVRLANHDVGCRHRRAD